MGSIRKADNAGDFYAHAVAIEREAATRYYEFSRHMRDQAQDTAELFACLAREDFEHARVLGRRTHAAKVAPGDYAWLDAGEPEPAAHEWLFRLMSARCALEIAMHAEERARKYFEEVLRGTSDKQVKAIAREFLDEEGEHIERMRRAFDDAPNLTLDWESVFDSGGPLAKPVASPKKSGRSLTK